jgi:hypothetical protein
MQTANPSLDELGWPRSSSAVAQRQTVYEGRPRMSCRDAPRSVGRWHGLCAR